MNLVIGFTIYVTKVKPKVGEWTTDSRLTNLKQTLLFSELARAMFMLWNFWGIPNNVAFLHS